LLFATFFNSELNFFLLCFATTTPTLIRLQELKNRAFPNPPLPNLAQDCLQISDVAIGTLDDCYTFLLGDKTRRTAILSFSATRRSEGLAGASGLLWLVERVLDGPLWMAHFGWPSVRGG
jgi:hypothetical protein